MSERGNTFELKLSMPESFEQSGEQPSTTSQGKKSGNTLRRMRKNGDQIANYNFKSIAKVGLAIRGTRMLNEAVGSYTENRLGQKRFNKNMLFGSYAIGIAKFGAFGASYAGIDMGYRVAMYNIDQGKKNREAVEKRRISGNNAYNGIRRGGNRL